MRAQCGHQLPGVRPARTSQSSGSSVSSSLVQKLRRFFAGGLITPGDMARGAEHEGQVAPEQGHAVVCGAPGHDMVFAGGENIGRAS